MAYTQQVAGSRTTRGDKMMSDDPKHQELPDSQKAAQAAKRRKWWADRNARRNERYENDPEYREKQKQARRESYARKNEGTPNCLVNLGSVDASGARVAVAYNGSPMVIGRVFTQTDLSKALNRRTQVFYRWHQRGLFPSPSLRDDKENMYYSDEEVKAFIRIMGEHQQQTPHYRADHTEVRDRLFAASFDKNPALALAWVRSHR